MNIRRACVGDIPRIDALLEQVCLIHHEGRPDLFKYGTRKYTHGQLEEIIADDSRPVFVAVDGSGYLCGYAFCIFIRHENDNILTDVRTLYIDDLCVDEVKAAAILKWLADAEYIVMEHGTAIRCYRRA